MSISFVFLGVVFTFKIHAFFQPFELTPQFLDKFFIFWCFVRFFIPGFKLFFDLSVLICGIVAHFLIGVGSIFTTSFFYFENRC